MGLFEGQRKVRVKVVFFFLTFLKFLWGRKLQDLLLHFWLLVERNHLRPEAKFEAPCFRSPGHITKKETVTNFYENYVGFVDCTTTKHACV